LWWCCCVCLLKAFHLEVNTEKKKKKSRVTSLSLSPPCVYLTRMAGQPTSSSGLAKKQQA
jgi:hypothetical protein